MQEIDESYLRRMTYAKALFQMGLQDFERGTPHSSAQAVLTFDNALEMMFRLAIDKLGIGLPERDRAYLPTLVRSVNARIAENQLKLASLDELHVARNKIQHNGILPDRSMVERYRSLTRETLAYLAQAVFDKDWKTVSLSELIRAQNVRNFYYEAELFFQEGKYKEAVFSLLNAFETAKMDEQRRIYGSGMMWYKFFSLFLSNKSDEVKLLLEYIDTVTKEIEVLKLRLDYKAYMKYRSLFDDTDPFMAPFLSDAGMEWDSKNVIGTQVKSKSEEGETWTAIEGISKQREAQTQEKARKLFLESIGRTSDSDLREWLDFAMDFVLDSILKWQRLKREISFFG